MTKSRESKQQKPPTRIDTTKSSKSLSTSSISNHTNSRGFFLTPNRPNQKPPDFKRSCTLRDYSLSNVPARLRVVIDCEYAPVFARRRPRMVR